MTLRPRAIRGLIREEKYDAKKFMIERDIPTIGKSTSEQLHAASKQSVRALKQVGPDVQWVQSYVTDDKLYCIYLTPDETAIREHARISGSPATKISPVRSTNRPDIG